LRNLRPDEPVKRDRPEDGQRAEAQKVMVNVKFV